jgi:hypothetical protein
MRLRSDWSNTASAYTFWARLEVANGMGGSVSRIPVSALSVVRELNVMRD